MLLFRLLSSMTRPSGHGIDKNEALDDDTKTTRFTADRLAAASKIFVVAFTTHGITFSGSGFHVTSDAFSI
jgi:predicted nucleic acid-binding Zn ribbon protein